MYKRKLGMLLILLLPWMPGAGGWIRGALARASFLLPFPVAGFLLAALILRFRLKRAVVALLLCLSLWMPLYFTPPPKQYAASPDPVSVALLAAELADKAAACSDAPILPLDKLSARCLELAGGMVKVSRFPEWMTLARIAGIFIPLTGEALVNPREPAFALPFIALHECAHQRGIADEGEANLWAFHTCLAADDPAFAYSACVYALNYCFLRLQVSDPSQAKRLESALSARVRDDLRLLGALDNKNPGTRAFPPWAGDYGDLVSGLIQEGYASSAASASNKCLPMRSQGVSMPISGE